MIDKKLEENIKRTKKFFEFWSKFHELYRGAIAHYDDSGAKEEEFLSTRSLVNSRFQDLMDVMALSHQDRLEKGVSVYEILSIDSLSEMSDDKLKKIEDFWTDSYIFLSSVLDRSRRKKRRIEKFNKFIFVTKNFLRGRRNDKKGNSA